MSADFVNISISTDQTVLAQNAITSIQNYLEANGNPGYTVQPGTLDWLLITAIASMASDVANQASALPPAVFRAYGTELMQIPYDQGAVATVQTTWTFNTPSPLGGYTIQAGWGVNIDGQIFYVTDAYTSNTGDTSASILLAAGASGSAYNQLGGVNTVVASYQEIDWLAQITTNGVTSGGADQETDTDYQNRLANVLTVVAPRPIVANDFSVMLLSDYCIDATDIEIGRVTTVDQYSPVPLSGTISTTSTSSNVTLTTPPWYESIPDVGATVTAAGIPSGSVVLATPAPTTSSFTVSNNATATASGVSASITSWTAVPHAVTSFVTDINGNALASGTMTVLQTWLQSLVMNNVTCYVEAPTYSTIYVTAEIHPLPGADPVGTASLVEQSLQGWLSQATWGNPGGSSTGANAWFNATQGYNTIRYNKAIGVAENLSTVDYCASLYIGFSPGPTGMSDLLMPGQAPLPLSNSTTINVTAV